MKHPIRSYVKLVAVQPQLLGVVYPVVGYGALCATADAVDTYRFHRLTGRPTDWPQVLKAAKEGFLSGVASTAMMAPVILVNAMRLPTPTLDELHKLDFGGSAPS